MFYDGHAKKQNEKVFFALTRIPSATIRRHAPSPTRPPMRLLLALLLCLATAACGDEPRRCLETAECFAGEYCTSKKVCAPYKGKVDVKPAPDHDMAKPTRP
jgi:hypothetical protein